MLLALVIASGCAQTCDRPKRSAQCEAFLSLPRPRRVIEAKTFSTDKQIDMYLCSTTEAPPDRELAYQIAERGDAAIPLVVGRLMAEKDELDQKNLIYALEIMSDKGHLRNRKDVIAQISKVIDEMKIQPFKEDSLEMLKRIEINSGIKPFTYKP